MQPQSSDDNEFSPGDDEKEETTDYADFFFVFFVCFVDYFLKKV